MIIQYQINVDTSGYPPFEVDIGSKLLIIASIPATLILTTMATTTTTTTTTAKTTTTKTKTTTNIMILTKAKGQSWKAEKLRTADYDDRTIFCNWLK